MEIFAGTRKAFHEGKVNSITNKLAQPHSFVGRMWLSSRLQAHERAHDSIVARGILSASKHGIRSMRGSREMYYSKEDAQRGYKTTRGWEVFDAVAFMGIAGLGVLELTNGHVPTNLEVATAGAVGLSFARVLLDVTHDEQYAAIVKAHNVLDSVGLRSPVKAYRRP